MNLLDAIELPDTMLWDNRMQAQGVATVHRRALDGSLVVFSGPSSRVVVLVAGDDYGWIPEAVALDLVALAEASSSVTLTWDGTQIPVQFDHSAGPAVALEPKFPGATWYTGTISLIRED